jgi:hypothetical protein
VGGVCCVVLFCLEREWEAHTNDGAHDYNIYTHLLFFDSQMMLPQAVHDQRNPTSTPPTSCVASKNVGAAHMFMIKEHLMHIFDPHRLVYEVSWGKEDNVVP